MKTRAHADGTEHLSVQPQPQKSKGDKAQPRGSESGSDKIESIGQLLRKHREKRGVTLEKLAQSTKIKEAALRLIEEENYAELPAPVFVKGFVTAYAREVGLDPKPIIAQLTPILEPTAEPVVDLTAPIPKEPAVHGGPRVNVALLVFVLVIVATLTLSILLRSPGPGAT